MGKYNDVMMTEAIEMFLKALGADLSAPNLKDTPKRVSKMYKVLLGGYDINTEEHVTTFPATSQDMVMLHDIPLYSFCSHHLLPFVGKIHIAYIPGDKIVGISKLARIARAHSKKLQVQEDLTKEIADDIEKLLKPLGVAVQIQAQHLCTTLRGVRSHGSIMTTCTVRGIFKDDIKARTEFLDNIRASKHVFSY